MDIRTALMQGQKILEDGGIDAPRLTAEVLLLHAVRHSEATAERAWLYAHSTDELKELWWIHYGRYLHERLKGRPTQYITGFTEFYGREFMVTRDVLIPRPETEHLIETALPIARTFESPRILDVGAGSGCVGVTLALELGSRVISTDVSAAALRIARANAGALHAAVDFLPCDLGSAFADTSFDVIVSNPPYIPLRDREGMKKEVRDFEPSLALFAGDDGLDVYQRLVPEAGRLLRPGGWLLMEIGQGQVEALRGLHAAWHDVRFVNDLAGIPRVVVARKG
jgi:release factor glutamine methyltransferase